MLSITDIRLESLATHYVGNKACGDELHISRQLVDPDMTTELRSTLLQFMFTPFHEEGSFHFWHPSDINLNEIYNYAGRIFDDPSTLLLQSSHIATHLYDSLILPHIKSGELHIAHFKGVPVDGILTDAIGIYKTDRLDTFLKIQPNGTNYQFYTDAGINPLLMEKGCLIINTGRPEGYKLFVVDKGSKGGHAQFWKDIFLKVRASHDEFHQTSDYLKMCKDFVVEEMPTAFEITRVDQIDLLNRTVDYFKKNEELEQADFKQAVLRQPEIIESFNKYQQQFQEDHEVGFGSKLFISTQAVKKQAKNFKSLLKLDKNFHVYVHGDRDLIEKGYDEAKGMNFYKIYYKEES